MLSKINNSKGFTLIELIVSVAILSIVVIGFLSIFVHGTEYIGMARHKSSSSTGAQSEANKFMSDPDTITTSSFIDFKIELVSGTEIEVENVTVITVYNEKNGQKSEIITIIP
jgi:prepilin-type N-terminal cleavage/methylation domain-containing protein